MEGSKESSQRLIDEFVGASHGDLVKVQQLLEKHPALIEAKARWNETAIGAASHSGQKEIAEFLLAKGAPLDICVASMLGMNDCVAAFLKADPGLSKARGAHGIPVLFHAAIRGHTDVAELLLEYGAEVNDGDGGNTALHGAAAFGRREMVRFE